MLTMVETTKATISNSTRNSLRITIPEFIVKSLEIKKGDDIEWILERKGDKVHAIFRKKEE